ncbi:sterol 3beta-glucosyltransferase [Marchantia polymorpha subsp. ruderalis]|uniref:sterol 3beta-glucosyltransferase n=1 Tax=Marchantia polymorpha TaxID=3197 RepID=A0A2R6WN77_MARPO|nr:hypothetical protein MARPO_0072s0049 [Marchantia polymorpha]BBN03348.1 hypothetical protein Mp_2g22830 [Marchantia polymorpha subsp. ruderalis]|eukprot:PTQ35304.1 hypothetical protein MARPO_0072s0049 [Marchantia polymorpha]
MNHEDDGTSYITSSSSASSLDNESILSDTFSFAPDANYQSMLRNEDPVATPMIQGPGKLVPRRSPDIDSSGDYFELEQRNGGSHLKNNQNGLTHLGTENAHQDNGDSQAKFYEDSRFGTRSGTGHELHHGAQSQPTLRSNPFSSNPRFMATTANSIGIDEGPAIGLENPYKLGQELGNRPLIIPKRQLLATTSAPVRLKPSELTADHVSTAESHEQGSECSSGRSSKSDLQSMSDQTGGATCASGPERALVRTKSLPSRSFSELEDRRANTQSGRRSKSNENRNVRLAVPEKMSDRKKKKMIKKLAPVNDNGCVEFDEAGSKRIASFLSGTGPGIFDEGGEVGEEDLNEEDEDNTRREVPPLQIVMLIVGTRGDVQPFVAIGKHLQGYGHRVRLATHSNFREFVMTAGLEFYPLGGDPKVLAGYMVKNKGFLPSGPSEVSVQRKQIKAIIQSLLPACTVADPEAGSGLPFRAQAIIANPPAYGHVHVAEYLQVPLHIFFTMPWTATSEFPHPLSRVKSPAGYRMSYQVVDSLIWWGIRSMINDFRKKKLKLRPITYLSGSQGSIAELPTGYIWSPHLVPKPRDWGPMVDVVGFCFLNLAQDYKPPQDLLDWLAAGSAPIYVGFGSLPVVDPKGMTEIIIKALKETKQRGIIYKGWGGIGDLKEVGNDIYLVEDCPHDWLFKQCVAVVHHGGAGTTAAGLKAGCPTTVVPFFGDQPFWGERIHAKGVGPSPIPVDQFSLDKLVKAIEFMLNDEVKQNALDIAQAMEKEDGVDGAVKAFHKHLPRDTPQPTSTHPPQRLRHKVFKPFRSVYNCFI